MKFFDRERELAELGKVEKQTGDSARMTVLTGRRRVGKTSLALEFTQSRRHLYLFVSKKSEPLLCAEYLNSLQTNILIYGVQGASRLGASPIWCTSDLMPL